jgi:fucose permease
MQFVLGFSPLQAGIRSVPIALMLMIVAPQSTKLAHRIGTKLTVAGGLGIVAVGLVVASTATPELGYGRVLPAQILLGIGIALAMAPATESIMGSLPREKAGVGSAMNDTTRQVGGALGVAVIGSVLSTQYTPAVTSSLSGSGLPKIAVDYASDSIGTAMQVAARLGGNPNAVDTPAGRQVADAARDAFASSMGRGLLVAAAFALVGALVALLFLPARAADAPAPDAVAVDDADDVTAFSTTTAVGGAEAVLARQEAIDEEHWDDDLEPTPVD